MKPFDATYATGSSATIGGSQKVAYIPPSKKGTKKDLDKKTPEPKKYDYVEDPNICYRTCLNRYKRYENEGPTICQECKSTDTKIDERPGNLAVLVSIFCFPCGLLACVMCQDTVAVCKKCDHEIYRQRWMHLGKDTNMDYGELVYKKKQKKMEKAQARAAALKK